MLLGVFGASAAAAAKLHLNQLKPVVLQGLLYEISRALNNANMIVEVGLLCPCALPVFRFEGAEVAGPAEQSSIFFK